jgi:UDP-N-acetylmuramate dehydrogenase
MVFQTIRSTTHSSEQVSKAIDPRRGARYYAGVTTVRELSRMFKIEGTASFDEPLSLHTSFRIGGPADLYVLPSNAAEAAEVLGACARESVPAFVLGGGTNLLVADRGIRGAVVDLSRLAGIQVDGGVVTAQAGTPISDVAEVAQARGLSGLEFAYSLPGSVGGAVWMNARCYGGEVSGVLAHVDYLEGPELTARHYRMNRDDWGYKRSPFQEPDRVVLSAAFRLVPGDPAEMRERMRSYREDRERKGHFRHPCAGSIFKNNRAFGAPSGQLIDSLGLKGRRLGGAQVAPYHGNILINTGEARAADMRALIEQVEEEVRSRLGFQLEREVILVGDWD